MKYLFDTKTTISFLQKDDLLLTKIKKDNINSFLIGEWSLKTIQYSVNESEYEILNSLIKKGIITVISFATGKEYLQKLEREHWDWKILQDESEEAKLHFAVLHYKGLVGISYHKI